MQGSGRTQKLISATTTLENNRNESIFVITDSFITIYVSFRILYALLKNASIFGVPWWAVDRTGLGGLAAILGAPSPFPGKRYALPCPVRAGGMEG